MSERIAFEFGFEDGETVESVVAFYKQECEQSREITAAHGLDEESRQPDSPHESLRWIMVHMVEETARHAGQMDILREQIDGAAGE
ncbi:MAG: DUF664 domain-containing protein [Candidatus Dormibacteraeota bacterium]|nr:DUF664 domain-containing protein [Candidatus Dormibacteraeota bacterium]